MERPTISLLSIQHRLPLMTMFTSTDRHISIQIHTHHILFTMGIHSKVHRLIHIQFRIPSIRFNKGIMYMGRILIIIIIIQPNMANQVTSLSIILSQITTVEIITINIRLNITRWARIVNI